MLDIGRALPRTPPTFSNKYMANFASLFALENHVFCLSQVGLYKYGAKYWFLRLKSRWGHGAKPCQ